jgi:EAL domain-containing protein (putative c-di-GMP-specific phosphodiesterase class I)
LAAPPTPATLQPTSNIILAIPVEFKAIDRSFIKDLPNDKNTMAVIHAIVGLGETFCMTVTAEGVEINEQAVLLALDDCTHLQGYLFCNAVPAGDIPTLIEHFSGAQVVAGA